jgi:hypothetical protein
MLQNSGWEDSRAERESIFSLSKAKLRNCYEIPPVWYNRGQLRMVGEGPLAVGQEAAQAANTHTAPLVQVRRGDVLG